MAEVEERINRIKNQDKIEGLMIVDEKGKSLRSTFSSNVSRKDGENNPDQYAKFISKLTLQARSVVRDINPNNDLTFFRVRAKKKEILVAPDKNLFLIVIQRTEDHNADGHL